MEIFLMKTDVHSPAFIRADRPTTPKKVEPQVPSHQQVHRSRIALASLAKLAVLLFFIVGCVYLLSKLVTPQVVTVVSILMGFLILRFIVRVVLQVTFTLLRYLFWLAVLVAIMLCVL